MTRNVMIAEAAILVVIVVLLVAIVVSSRRRKKRLAVSPVSPDTLSEDPSPSDGPGSTHLPSFPSPASAPAPALLVGAVTLPAGTGPNGTGPNGTGPNGTGPNGTGDRTSSLDVAPSSPPPIWEPSTLKGIQSAVPAPLPDAGTSAAWLPDPGGTPGTLRYWDGHAWTDFFAQRA